MLRVSRFAIYLLLTVHYLNQLMPYPISVLISTYNNRGFVSKKIKEISAQTLFEHAEFIFIETASPEKERAYFAIL